MKIVLDRVAHNLGRMAAHYSLTAILAACALWIAGCDQSLVPRNDLEAIKSRGELIMITRNNATCYYEGSDGPAGFEYDLVKDFADTLGVKLRMLVLEEEADMVEALLQGKADIIAAGFPFGQQSARLLALGPGYLTVQEQLVGHRSGLTIKDVKDLSKTTIVMTGSSARLELLKELKSTQADITWQILPGFSAEEVMQMVWDRSVALTLIESNILKLHRRFYPELVVHLDLGKPQPLCWGLDPRNRHLHQAVSQWFSKSAIRETIQGLTSHYFDHLEEIDYIDLMRYRQRIADRLPTYQPFFEAAAEQYRLDWQLVAALAYQESHWNPKSKSFTGVRGIMMLTEETAKALGLTDRLAVEETIFAGTQYLAQLHRLVGDDIAEPDRTLMALAAYNLGLGHVQDARRLATRMGKPADKWHGLRSVLPLLQQKQHYQDLPHGYARGKEAVHYVDRIRTYHKVLTMALEPTQIAQANASSTFLPQ